jgi:hypothetical protein
MVQQNTPHRDKTTKYIVRRWKIKAHKYVKITLIYYNGKEKQFGGVIQTKIDLKSPLCDKTKMKKEVTTRVREEREYSCFYFLIMMLYDRERNKEKKMQYFE